MKSIKKGDMNAELARDVYAALLWSTEQPPSFVPSFTKTLSQYLHSLLNVLGYYQSEFTVELVTHDSQLTAELHITFKNEGVRSQIGAIKLVGNKINSDEQVLSYLGLKTGQLLDDILIKEIQRKLYTSGRFRFFEVTPVIDSDKPLESTLTITMEETEPATPLDGKLSEKEALMQKVGQFMARYRLWDKDVVLRLDLDDGGSMGTWFQELLGASALSVELVYSTQKGIILTEMANQTQILNQLVLSPEQVRYFCPILNYHVLSSDPKGQVLVEFTMAPIKDGEHQWSVMLGGSIKSASDEETSLEYQPDVDVHPAYWFHLANRPDTGISYDNNTLAHIHIDEFDIQLDVDPRNGEVIQVLYQSQPVAQFEKGAYDKQLEALERNIGEQKIALSNAPFNLTRISQLGG